MNYSFFKVACAIPDIRVADCFYNTERIVAMAREAASQGVQAICFPELSITGYTCGDLFNQSLLIERSLDALKKLLDETAGLDIIILAGMPLRVGGKLLNVAVICQQGSVKGVVPKTYLPNYNEFYEKRWFISALDVCHTHSVSLAGSEVPFGTRLLFEAGSCTFAVELCEDLWATIPPSSMHAIAGATLLFNLSASNALVGKTEYVRSLVQQQSARCLAGYVYCSSGCGESTTDLVFAGNAMIAESGTIIASSERFSLKEQLVISEIDFERLTLERSKNTTFLPLQLEEPSYVTLKLRLPETEDKPIHRVINRHPFIPTPECMDSHCRDIFSIQTAGLIKRLKHTGATKVVIGISGGLDSTLALLVSVRAFDRIGLDRKGIQGITMPGFGTTDRTYTNALNLMKDLGVTIREISISEAVLGHFKDIGHDPKVLNVTYENSQARERTQILMDVANQCNGLVIGTGDLSELALGWATYNGDHMSMYAVNSSIPKTLVRILVRWVADNQMDATAKETLLDIIDTPVSPELLPANEEGGIAQKTEDLVGPYELHDFFLYYMIRFGFAPRKILYLATIAFKDYYEVDAIQKWIRIFYRRFFSQQFKRSCMPDGPKVGSINLSPRGDWRMPSDAVCKMWLDDLES